MKIAAIKQAIISTLGAGAGGQFRVVGYGQRSQDELTVKGVDRTVQVVYTSGQFPRGMNALANIRCHEMTFAILLTVSSPCKVDLATIEDPATTPAQIALALASLQNAEYLADQQIDDLWNCVFNILLDADNVDFGLSYTIGSRELDNYIKHPPKHEGQYVVIQANVELKCRIDEDLPGATPKDLERPLVNLLLQLNEEDVADIGAGVVLTAGDVHILAEYGRLVASGSIYIIETASVVPVHEIFPCDPGDTVATGTADMTCRLAAGLFCHPGLATGLDDGTSWENAYKTIAHAMSHASSGDEIWVKESTTTLGSALTYVGGVNVYGGFDSSLTGTSGSISGRNLTSDVTTIDGQDTYNAFNSINGSIVYFNGLKFYRCGGSAARPGGAFSITSCSYTFLNCTFDSCTTPSSGHLGGAIYAVNHTSSNISGCTFISCHTHAATAFGGAIAGTGTGILNVGNCVFTSCSSSAGALYVSSELAATDCTFNSCAANAYAGGGGFHCNNNKKRHN